MVYNHNIFDILSILSYNIRVIFYFFFNLIIRISKNPISYLGHIGNLNFSCRRVLVPFGLWRFMGPIDTHRANHEPQRQKAQARKGNMANNRKYFYDLAHISAALIIAISGTAYWNSCSSVACRMSHVGCV